MNCRRLIALVPLLLLGPVACGTAVLPAAAVADGAEKALEQQIGVRPDVSCPRDIEATVGVTTRCTATPPGDATTYGVTVTLTKVEDEQAVYDVDVDKDAVTSP